MTQLNIAYLINIFAAALDAKEKGTYAIVPLEAPEVKELVARKYIKTNKRLHNEDGNVGAVVVEGATMADLKIDFEVPDAPAAPAAPQAPFEAPVAEDTTMQHAQAAPTFQPELAQAPVAEAPVAPVVETPIHETVMTQAHVANVGEGVATAPVVVEDGVRVIGAGIPHAVVAAVNTRNGEVEIELGVPFEQKLSKAEQRKERGTVQHHPYDDIAKVKLENPTAVPSFHLAGRSVKDMGNSVKRANKRYEAEGSRVTFRVAAVTEKDPKGAGVRVYAFFNEEAPALRTVKKKDAAE